MVEPALWLGPARAFQTNSREVEVLPDEGRNLHDHVFQTNSREVEVTFVMLVSRSAEAFQTNSREVEVIGQSSSSRSNTCFRRTLVRLKSDRLASIGSTPRVSDELS